MRAYRRRCWFYSWINKCIISRARRHSDERGIRHAFQNSTRTNFSTSHRQTSNDQAVILLADIRSSPPHKKIFTERSLGKWASAGRKKTKARRSRTRSRQKREGSVSRLFLLWSKQASQGIEHGLYDGIFFCWKTCEATSKNRRRGAGGGEHKAAVGAAFGD